MLVGASAIEELARQHRVDLDDPLSVARSDPFIRELARRVGLGVAAIGSVLDPALFVLSGETPVRVGGLLADPVAEATQRVILVRPRVEVSRLGMYGPLRGARAHALTAARKGLMDRLSQAG